MTTWADHVRDAWRTARHPGRDRRFLSSLPPEQRRRYYLRLMGQWHYWAAVAVLLLPVLFLGRLDFAEASANPVLASLGTTVAYLLAVGLPACFVVSRFHNGWLRRAIERDHPTLCPTCGYDRRGTPAGRCPECGTVAAAAPV